MTWLNPDCRDGKHRACRGDAWDLDHDRATNCGCECHQVDLARTRVVLAGLQGDQERLAAQLAATGLVSFADRADWLLAHATPDEQLAWRRRWEHLGLTVDEPTPRRMTDHAARSVVCVRCGVDRLLRVAHPSPLCADCRYVMSAEEIALWVGEEAA